jgi:diacylglycerol kinase family enzyme
MYAYIFDSFLQDRKYVHDISQIENRLVALGIQGRTEKMTILKNLAEGARQAIKRGATTLVVVGNDETITRVLPILTEHEVTLGIIPLGPHQSIANILGIPEGVAACDTVSRRVIRHLDMGRANNAYFLFSLVAPATVSVDCGRYTISSTDPAGTLTITNFSLDGTTSKPDDGKLELVVAAGEHRRGWGIRRDTTTSVFSITKATLTCAGTPATVTLDGQVVIKTPIELEVGSKKVDVIVGKSRHF